MTFNLTTEFKCDNFKKRQLDLIKPLDFGKNFTYFFDDAQNKKYFVKLFPNIFTDTEFIKTIFFENVILPRVPFMDCGRTYYHLDKRNNATIVSNFVGFDLHDKKPNFEKFFKDIILQINQIESCGFIHTDIKPENILLSSSGDCYLIDLDLAYYLNDTFTKTITPPEMFYDENGFDLSKTVEDYYDENFIDLSSYTFSSYCFGMTCLEIYLDRSDYDKLMKVLKKKHSIIMKNGIPVWDYEIETLLKKLIKKSPELSSKGDIIYSLLNPDPISRLRISGKKSVNYKIFYPKTKKSYLFNMIKYKRLPKEKLCSLLWFSSHLIDNFPKEKVSDLLEIARDIVFRIYDENFEYKKINEKLFIEIIKSSSWYEWILTPINFSEDNKSEVLKWI